MSKQRSADARIVFGVLAATWFFGVRAAAQSAEASEPAAVELPAWAVWLAWSVVPVAALLLGGLAASGVLSLIRLRDAPRRALGLGWLDVFVGVWLWLMGQLLAGLAIGALRTADAQADAASNGAAVAIGHRPELIVLSQMFAFGPGVAWWVCRMSSTPRWVYVSGLLPEKLGRDVVWTVLGLPAVLVIFMATQQVSAAVAAGLGHPPPQIQHSLLVTYTQMRDAGAWGVIAGLVFSTVVVAPLLEELFHRGLLQTALVNALQHNTPETVESAARETVDVRGLMSFSASRWVSPIWVRPVAIGAVSVFFVTLHLGAVPWVAVPGLLVLSVCFGFLYERTGSLWPPLLVHAGFNAINVSYVLAAA